MHTDILILHPEGNFNTNPHLSAFIEELCARGHSVELAAPRLSIRQEPVCDGMRLRLGAAWLTRAQRWLARQSWAGPLLALTTRWQFPRCAAGLVIGVDALGIILAAHLARRAGAPTALISYELLFDDEVGATARAQEKAACRELAFAVVQDRERGALLARENGIDPQRLVYMPVAGSGEGQREPGWLRERLGIPAAQRIAIVIGSTDEWTGFPALVRGLVNWPPDWCLVVHHRYGLNEELARWVDPAELEKVYVSTDTVHSSRDLGRVLGDADLGLALYLPDQRSDLSGRNLECIGMASGKIATCLQFGVPVLVNEIGEMAGHVRAHGLGTVVESVADVPAALAAMPAVDEASRRRCQAFFNTQLDVRVTGRELFATIDRLLAGGKP